MSKGARPLIAPRNILWVSALVYFFVLVFNDGLMALDEYFVGIIRYIPAQTTSIFTLVGLDDVKAPLQLIPQFLVAQFGLWLGIEHPYYQYRFVLGFFGVLHFAVLAFVFNSFFSRGSRERIVLLVLFAFYFVAPFAFTRSMFETLAAPWVALAAWGGHRYFVGGGGFSGAGSGVGSDSGAGPLLRDLLLGVFAISVAFALRPQVGVLAVGLAVLPLILRRWRDFFWLCVVGLGLFVACGFVDLWLRGEFHYSLKAVLFYNIAHGAEYGQHSVFTYPALIFALCFGPWMIRKYPAGFWPKWAKELFVPLGMLLLFVILHSLFPQKWERFLISVIPLMMILMTPLLVLLWTEWPLRKWRLASLLIFNFFLFFVASFFPPQKNLINLALYLDEKSENVAELVRVDNTPGWFTDRFIREIKYRDVNITFAELSAFRPLSCKTLLVVPEKWTSSVDLGQWKQDSILSVNLVESLAYRMNPAANQRRAPLHLYLPHCAPR